MVRPTLDDIFGGSANRPSLDEIFAQPPAPDAPASIRRPSLDEIFASPPTPGVIEPDVLFQHPPGVAAAPEQPGRYTGLGGRRPAPAGPSPTPGRYTGLGGQGQPTPWTQEDVSAAFARLKMDDDALAATIDSTAPGSVLGARLLEQRETDRALIERYLSAKPPARPYTPTKPPAPAGQFQSTPSPVDQAGIVIPRPPAFRAPPQLVESGGAESVPTPRLERGRPTLGDEVEAFGKNFGSGASAGLYEPDPDLVGGSDLTAVAGRVAGSILGVAGAGVATAGAGAPAALGPATFMTAQFLSDLRRRGVPLNQLTQTEILLLATASGLASALVPLSVGGRTSTRLASGVVLGAGQNMADEAMISAISNTPPEHLEAALMGGAMAGTLVLSAPVYRAIRRVLGDRRAARIAEAAVQAQPEVPRVFDVPRQDAAPAAAEASVTPEAPAAPARAAAAPSLAPPSGVPETPNVQALRASGLSDEQIRTLAEIPAFRQVMEQRGDARLPVDVEVAGQEAPPTPLRTTAEDVAGTLLTPPVGFKPRRGRTLYVHPEDLGALGIQAEEGGRRFKVSEARRRYGAEVVVTPRATRVSDLASRAGMAPEELVVSLRRDRAATAPGQRPEDGARRSVNDRVEALMNNEGISRVDAVRKAWDEIVAEAREQGQMEARNQSPAVLEILNQEPVATAGAPKGNAAAVHRAAQLWREKGTDSPFFRKWFGDSKVVDEQGKPRVVYHGTVGDFDVFFRRGTNTQAQSARKGYFFIDRPDVAGEYATHFLGREAQELKIAMDHAETRAQKTGARTDWDAYDRLSEAYDEVLLKERYASAAPGANVMPVYLRMMNPRVFDFEGRAWEEGRMNAELDAARSAGNDGVIFRNVDDDPGQQVGRLGTVYVAFGPEQIKSATGNRGTFGQYDPSILRQSQPSIGGARGSFELQKLPDGTRRAVIKLFTGRADFSTFTHETAHYLRRVALEGEDLRVIEGWLQRRGIMDEKGTWTREAEEAWADGMERYFRDGRAPSNALRAAFEKIRGWMREVYQRIQGTRLAERIPDDVREVYDRILGADPADPARAAAAPRAEDAPGARGEFDEYSTDYPETLFQPTRGEARSQLKSAWYEVKRTEGRHETADLTIERVSRLAADRAMAGGVERDLARYTARVPVAYNRGLNHVWFNHSRDAKAERAGGQIPISEADIARLPEVISSPDQGWHLPTRDSRGNYNVEFDKRYPDGWLVTRWGIKPGSQVLELSTMFKVPLGGSVRRRGGLVPLEGGLAERIHGTKALPPSHPGGALPKQGGDRDADGKNIPPDGSGPQRLFQPDVDPQDEAFIRQLAEEASGDARTDEADEAGSAGGRGEPLPGEEWARRRRETSRASAERARARLEEEAASKSPAEHRAEMDALAREAISYDDKPGAEASGFLTRAEQFYTDYINEAYPLEKIERETARQLGREFTPQESIRFAVDRVLGAGGAANQFIDDNLTPILRGGEVDGEKFPGLSPDDTRWVDQFLLARDVLWRLDNVEEFDGGMMTRGEAENILRKHYMLPAQDRVRIEQAANALVGYAKKLARRLVQARVWTLDEFDQVTRDPFYIPLLRDWKKVRATPDGGAGAKRAFTSSDKLLRGYYDPGLAAPWKDPITALVSETHRQAAEIAKMGVWNRVVDAVEKNTELQKWIRRVPKGTGLKDAQDMAGPTGGVVSVLRPRRIRLEPEDKKFAQLYGKAKENLEEGLSLEAMQREADRARKWQLDLQEKIYREVGKKTMSREQAQAVDKILERQQQNRVKWLEKRKARDEAIVQKFSELPKEKQNQIEDWLQEGKPSLFIVPKEISDIVNGMTPIEWAWFAKPFVASASLFRRMQVGWNPAFTGANVPRDLQEAYYTVGFKPWLAFKGLYHYLKDDQIAKEYRRWGGSMEGDESGFRSSHGIADEIRYKSRYMKLRDAAAWKEKKVTEHGEELTERKLARLAYGASLPLRATADFVEAIGEAGEMMTRLGIFEAAMKQKELSKPEAIRLARQATLDFRRIGSKMRQANQLIPFLNARIQGSDRMARAAMEDPVGAATRAFVVAVVPAIVTLAWNQQNPNYADIPSWEKEYYWIVMKNKTGPEYFKIAKGHLAQMVVNPFQMMAENWLGTGKVSGWEIAADVLTGVSPIQDATGVLPPLLQEVVEQSANFDTFFRRNIVRATAMPAGYQTNPGTAETLRALGEALTVLPGSEYYGSPERIQHVLQGLFGGTATNVLFALDELLGKAGVVGDRKLRSEHVPLLNRFIGIAREWKSDFDREQREIQRTLRALRGGRDSGDLKRFRRQYAQAVEAGEGEDYLLYLERYIERGVEAVQRLEEEARRRLDELEAEDEE